MALQCCRKPSGDASWDSNSDTDRRRGVGGSSRRDGDMDLEDRGSSSDGFAGHISDSLGDLACDGWSRWAGDAETAAQRGDVSWRWAANDLSLFEIFLRRWSRSTPSKIAIKDGGCRCHNVGICYISGAVLLLEEGSNAVGQNLLGRSGGEDLGESCVVRDGGSHRYSSIQLLTSRIPRNGVSQDNLRWSRIAYLS